MGFYKRNMSEMIWHISICVCVCTNTSVMLLVCLWVWQLLWALSKQNHSSAVLIVKYNQVWTKPLLLLVKSHCLEKKLWL